jgi:K+-sensing histidine kinase KdpD
LSFDDVLRKAVQEVSELSEERLPMIEVEENNITANVDAVRLAQSISAVLREMLEYSTEDTILKIDTQAKEKVVLVTITARGKECSQKALDRKTARGRLAVDLLRAIVEQHQGATEIKASDKQLEVKLEIPDS